jgi:mevalonate kinase
VTEIAGKTFLVGEYSVLVGGEALGLATAPCFELSENQTEYHPNSAVGLFCKRNHFQFSAQVKNPYVIGGFGQSTAEFIFSWLAKNKKMTSLIEIFNEYINLYNSENLKNIKPSGADLVIQLLGQVVHFARPVEESKSFIWPFAELSFFVISTGLKIQTHEHLAQLDRDKLFELPQYSQKVIESFFDKSSDLFLKNLKMWSEKLIELGLQHSDVLKIKAQLETFSKIKFVKPCGALGADVCLVFCKTSDKQDVQNYLLSQNIKIQSDETQLAKGLI